MKEASQQQPNKEFNGNKQYELKDFEQFERKAEKVKKQKINKKSESYMDYGLDEEEDINQYKRFIK